MGGQRNKVDEIALETELPYTIMDCTLTKKLGLRKIGKRWAAGLRGVRN
jgi:hypothetical protein